MGLLAKCENIKKRRYYKLSVWDSKLKHYVVKHCSLTDKRACELESQFMAMGFITRVSPH